MKPGLSLYFRDHTTSDQRVLIHAVVESVADEVATAVQESWDEIQVPQCGYCQTGQVMTAIALLRAIPQPSDADIDGALTGNICRCSNYNRYVASVLAAAEKGTDGA